MPPERRQAVSVVGLAIALTVLTGWSLRYFARYQPFADLIQASQQSPLGEIGLEIESATLTGRAAGRRQWRIQARRIAIRRDGRTVEADGLSHGAIYGSEGRPVIALSGGAARFQGFAPLILAQTAGRLQIDGPVRAVVLRPGGPVLTAPGLRWDGLTRAAQTVGPASAVFPRQPGPLSGLTVRAESLSWDGRRGVLTAPAASLRWADGAWATGKGVTADIQPPRLAMHSLRGGFPAPSGIVPRMGSSD